MISCDAKKIGRTVPLHEYTSESELERCWNCLKMISSSACLFVLGMGPFPLTLCAGIPRLWRYCWKATGPFFQVAGLCIARKRGTGIPPRACIDTKQRLLNGFPRRAGRQLRSVLSVKFTSSLPGSALRWLNDRARNFRVDFILGHFRTGIQPSLQISIDKRCSKRVPQAMRILT